MAQYSAYFLDENKHVVSVTLLECASDEEAGRRAAALVDKNPIELWLGERCLGRINPSRRMRPASNRTNPKRSPAAGRAPGGASPFEKVVADAVALHKSGKLDQAERLYESILGANPNDDRVLSFLGALYCERGDFERAVEVLRLSLEKNARQPAALTTLGTALHRLRRYREAIASLDQAIRLKPDYAEPHRKGGDVLLALGRPRQALACYEKALSLKSDDPEAYVGRGSALRSLGRCGQALESCDKAIELRADSAAAHRNRADALLDLNRPHDALASYDKSVALEGDDPATLLGRGNALSRLGRFEEALACYDKAIELRPDWSPASKAREVARASFDNDRRAETA